MRASFVKMHGAGNDFAVFDERRAPLGLSAPQIAVLADRHRGIGCDQLISIEPSGRADAFMRIRNPDGSEAGACGNATRCVAMLLAAESGREMLAIETIAGVLPAEILGPDRVRVDMGAPRFAWNEIPLARPLDTLHLPPLGGQTDGAALSMGNPHVTFFVPDAESVPLADVGPPIEHDPLFPERVNVGFATMLAPDRMRLRVWERGAGATRACGSAACAAVVNASQRGLGSREMRVVMDGGTLEIAWHAEGHVLMAGPVLTAFTGEIDLAAYPP
ncbi:MAG TPA: diaminopimelate epimerase [Acetobacteraceae bacterium]|nr:diaminopimelate epimerase [Acetobacteraceae bacterium]